MDATSKSILKQLDNLTQAIDKRRTKLLKDHASVSDTLAALACELDELAAREEWIATEREKLTAGLGGDTTHS